MDKKVARLQRWLDRMSAACDHKRWDSAVVEVDSLCAEAREAREDFCRLMDGEEQGVRHRIFTRDAVAMSLKSAAIAMFIVMASTIPLAVEADRPWTAPVAAVKEEKEPERLGWMTKEEENLLRAIRAEAEDAKKAPAAVVRASTTRTVAKAQTAKPAAVPAPQPAPAAQKKKTAPEMATEDLMALIQAGEKALRGGEPAIRIIK